jgi:Derlin-2/3
MIADANTLSLRTMATATFIVSVGIYTGLFPYKWFFFHPSLLWKIPPEIWRLATSFMITGPQLSVLFDTYFGALYLVGSVGV